MKIILERHDLIVLLGKAMKRNLTESDVEVNVDPFEVIIHDATGVLGGEDDAAPPAASAPTPRQEKRGEDSPITTADDMSLEEMAKKSAALAMAKPETGRGAKKARARMVGEVDEPRPPVDPLSGDDE